MTGTRGTDSENDISYVLLHGADLNTNINVTIVANNRLGMGTSINGPAIVPVATIGMLLLFFVCLFFLTGMACSEPKTVVNHINFLLVETHTYNNNHSLSYYFFLIFLIFLFLFICLFVCL